MEYRRGEPITDQLANVIFILDVMTKLYGIKQCDTVRKARKWLDGHGVSYAFIDLREDGVSARQLRAWLDAAGADTLINRRSTTWKNLDAQQRDRLQGQPDIDLILAQPTLLKRPILESGGTLLVGFKEAEYKALSS